MRVYRYSECIGPRGVYRPWEIRRPVYRKNTYGKTVTVTGRQKEQDSSPSGGRGKKPGAVAKDNYDPRIEGRRRRRVGISRLLSTARYTRRLNISARPLRVDTGTGLRNKGIAELTSAQGSLSGGISVSRDGREKPGEVECTEESEVNSIRPGETMTTCRVTWDRFLPKTQERVSLGGRDTRLTPTCRKYGKCSGK